MQYTAPLTLARTYAAHIGRSLYTVAARVGVHPKFFQRLEAGHGCRVDTYAAVLGWFDANWPDDLDWPGDVLRPSEQTPKRKRRAA
jgi:hypothetical protein